MYRLHFIAFLKKNAVNKNAIQESLPIEKHLQELNLFRSLNTKMRRVENIIICLTISIRVILTLPFDRKLGRRLLQHTNIHKHTP